MLKEAEPVVRISVNIKFFRITKQNMPSFQKPLLKFFYVEKNEIYRASSRFPKYTHAPDLYDLFKKGGRVISYIQCYQNCCFSMPSKVFQS